MFGNLNLSCGIITGFAGWMKLIISKWAAVNILWRVKMIYILRCMRLHQDYTQTRPTWRCIAAHWSVSGVKVVRNVSPLIDCTLASLNRNKSGPALRWVDSYHQYLLLIIC